MILYKKLKDSKSLLESAFRLFTLEPLSVLESDLMEKELHKGYHLFARDAHGIFGTATLTERPIKSLSDSLKCTLDFYGKKTYYELSLVYATLPHGLQEKFTLGKENLENLTTRYYQLFYQELFDFLRKNLDGVPLVVATTQSESENMSFFGDFSFKDVCYNDGSFHGVLDLPIKNQLPPVHVQH